MRFIIALVVPLFAARALAGPVAVPDGGPDNDHDREGGLRKICAGLRTMEHGCVRCTNHLTLLEPDY